MKKVFFVPIILLMPLLASAKDFSFLKPQFEKGGNRYVIYVDKGEKKLWLVGKGAEVIKEYKIATGKEKGNKLYRGDNRTPSGRYTITQAWLEYEPLYLKKLKEEAESGEEKAVKRYKKAEKRFKKGKKSLKRMNSVYFKAEDGHTLWGSEKDLGSGVYGVAFLRLSFPEEDDKKRWKAAKEKGLIPKKNGRFLKPGSGIAIHGTNDNNSLGHNASSGCIRMKNEEVRELADYAKLKTVVIIK